MRTFKTKAGSSLPLLDIKGKEYLQVAWRVFWMREEHPDWGIETELTREKDHTFAKATIKDAAGRVIATAHKFEDVQGFADHAEKAETGAIGRALGLCGYGTQFEPEFEEGSRLADSPLPKNNGLPKVYPESPPPTDGVAKETGYRIGFGKWARRGLDEVPLNELKDYVVYIEEKAEKEGKPLSSNVAEFIDRAYAHITAMESGSRDENDVPF